jgi:hypothetical protein
MLTAEADVQTEQAARYLARLCGHAGKMGTVGHRPRSHASGGAPPEIRHVECSETEGTVSLNWGRWTMRALPGLLAVRAEAADEESLRRIKDLLTARLQKFGRRERLTVNWQDTGLEVPHHAPFGTSFTERSQDPLTRLRGVPRGVWQHINSWHSIMALTSQYGDG